jgi:hypothetical protein
VRSTALMAKKDHDMLLLFGSIVKEEYSFHGQGHPVISIERKAVDPNLVLS